MLHKELREKTVVSSPAERLSTPKASRNAGRTGPTMAVSSAAMKTPMKSTCTKRRCRASPWGKERGVGVCCWLIKVSEWGGSWMPRRYFFRVRHLRSGAAEDSRVAKYAEIQAPSQRLPISVVWCGSASWHEPMAVREHQPPVASLMHFLVKLFLAAPASFLSAACASQVAVAAAKAAAASFSHF